MSIPGAASPLLLASAADEEFSIERSLRFNSADSAYLNRTPSSAGNRKTWTWSGWVKRTELGTIQHIFASSTFTPQNDQTFIGFTASDEIYVANYETATPTAITTSIYTSSVYRDLSAWYHIVVATDTTQSTASDRVKLYVNGLQVTQFSSATYPTLNYDTFVNRATLHAIGRAGEFSTYYADAYLADVHLIDGQALDPTDFGEFDDSNVWQPKAYAGTYGTNGFHLDFSDDTNTTTIAEDSSGNGNDWTANNISVTAGAGNDSLFDSPINGTQTDTGAGGEVSGNYCTWNEALPYTNVTLSNGNLNVAGSANYRTSVATIGMISGKWYWEITVNGSIPYDFHVGIGTINFSVYIGTWAASTSEGWSYTLQAGLKYHNNSGATYGQSAGAGDVIGVAFDADAGTLTFYKNGVSQGQAYSSLTTGPYFPTVSTGNGNGCDANFGQRPFAYSAPSGYKCLCTANLDDPTIADGSTEMDVALYTGNSSTQTISGLNFSPDLVWIKSRSQSRDHKLVDSVRGTGQELEPNQTASEATNSDGLTAFNADGFDLGADADYNISGGNTYVAWAWDAGASTVSNTDGSTTANVRANASAGCSIVSYTGTSANATIGHGLNAAPEFVLIKNRDRAINWIVYHASLGATKYLELNTSDAAGTASSYFNNTAPTSSVVSLGAAVAVNFTGEDIIAYCFAPVEGYSAFGSYEGNGDADGPFVYTGFRPQFVITKITSSTGDWFIWDDQRLGYNLTNAIPVSYTHLTLPTILLV